MVPESVGVDRRPRYNALCTLQGTLRLKGGLLGEPGLQPIVGGIQYSHKATAPGSLCASRQPTLVQFRQCLPEPKCSHLPQGAPRL